MLVREKKDLEQEEINLEVHPTSLESYPQVSHPLLEQDPQRIAKLDRTNEVAPPTKVAPSVARVGRILTLLTRVCSSLQTIRTARAERNLSQKDLAQKINEKPSVIQDYESGKAFPNLQILVKLEGILNVKLRGKINSDHSKQF